MLGRFAQGQVTDKSSLGSSNSLPTHDQRETLRASITRGESAPVKRGAPAVVRARRLDRDQWKTYRIRRKQSSRSYWIFITPMPAMQKVLSCFMAKNSDTTALTANG